LHQEKFEDTKGVIRSLELKDKILVTVMQSVTNVPQTNNTSTSGMNEE
jgi:hypothetical protein